MNRALCIGINYRNTSAALGGCEADARDMADIVNRCGYSVDVAYQMPADYLFRKLAQYEQTQTHKDKLLVSFSGHGTQVPGDEPDQYDEGIVCWNGRDSFEVVRDDDFNSALARIPGSVFVVLDTCYSGGMDRMPKATARKFMPFDPESMQVFRPAESRDAKPVKSNRLYYLQACAESEVAYDLGTNGLFTAAFVRGWKQWNGGTISRLMNYAVSECAPDQRPQYRLYGGRPNRKAF